MSKNSEGSSTCIGLPTYDGELLNAIIETPKGSRAKYAYDPQLRLFKLKKVLPAGAEFPHNFGFLPSTKGGDGDPLDVLVLMEAVAYPGCLLPARLIGVIEAEQCEKNGAPPQRNDRLIAVATSCPTYGEVTTLDELSAKLIEQIEYFFHSYNKLGGKRWNSIARHGPKHANRIIKQGMAAYV